MPVLKAGSKGGEVKKTQESLNKAGSKPKLKPDGMFGPNTTKAVQHFQKQNKLKADGVVGKKTQAALQSSGQKPADNKPADKVAAKGVKWPYDDFVKYAKQRRDIDVVIAGLKKDVETAAKAMPKGAERSALEKELKDLLAGIDKVHVPLIANATGIADKQLEFHKVAPRDPAKGAAIVKSVEKDVKQHKKLREIANKPYFELEALAERVKKGGGSGGGKAPKWPYGDYKPLMKNCRDDRRDIEKDFKLSLKMAGNLPKNKDTERAIASLKDCWKRFEKVEFQNYANVSRVADKQMDFDKAVKAKDHAAAAAIVKEVEKDQKEVTTVQKATRKVYEELEAKMHAIKAFLLE